MYIYMYIWSSISFIRSNSSWATWFASLTSCSRPSSNVAQLHTLVVVSFESTLMAQKTPQIYIYIYRNTKRGSGTLWTLQMHNLNWNICNQSWAKVLETQKLTQSKQKRQRNHYRAHFIPFFPCKSSQSSLKTRSWHSGIWSQEPICFLRVNYGFFYGLITGS